MTNLNIWTHNCSQGDGVRGRGGGAGSGLQMPAGGSRLPSVHAQRPNIQKITPKSNTNVKTSQGNSNTPSAKGLIGKDFEGFLTNQLGGTGGFSKGGRDFDGGNGNTWWEAKSGDYWNKILEGKYGGVDKFKSDMGDRLRIAKENGAKYDLYSNSKIPQAINDWLTKKGIHFREFLD